jgi:regulator of sigma E protease
VALFPLGGYVNMVGEGPEADEDEDYPRSFKNKSVGQRMLIISAGVIMNVLFGALCFMIVYRYFGAPEPPAIVWQTEPGSRAWQAGVQPGWRLVQLNDKESPSFRDMQRAVALSAEGQPIEFTFEDRQGSVHKRTIEPFRDENGLVPVIGVRPPSETRLVPERYRRLIALPVLASRPAAFARVIELSKDDVLKAASDPDKKGEMTSLPAGLEGWQELCRRMLKAGNETIKIEVGRAGGADRKTMDIAADGFHFGDMIVGTTNPDTPDQPFNILALPPDPTQPNNAELRDPFVLKARMRALAGQPMVFQVNREGAARSAPTVHILVAPAYHVSLGMRMKMGKVAAIRANSPASESGLKTGATDGDIITGVRLQYKNEPVIVLDDRAMDPVRLPFEIERHIRASGKEAHGWRVILTVKGPVNHDAGKERTLPPLNWDDRYVREDEKPIHASAPMSIPQLGIAYWVESTVVKVEPSSPAEEAGVKAGDVVCEINWRMRSLKKDKEQWSGWVEMASQRGKQKEVYDQWAFFFFWRLQETDFAIVKLKVKRVTGDTSEVIELPARNGGSSEGIKAVADLTWPMSNRGLDLWPDTRSRKAESFVEALLIGMDETIGLIRDIYRNLSRLFSGRISTKSLGGPIEIGAQAINAASESLSRFALFLGMISINLAVVNFLPIPVLDGGHMVFLIYEKLRGRPPSETIRVIATYAGLFLILGLMIFVFRLDFNRRVWPWIKDLFSGG